MTLTPRNRLRRRLTATLVLVVVLTGLGTTPGSAADGPLGQYWVDIDSVRLGGPDAQFGAGLHGELDYPNPGTLAWYRDSATGRVRAQLSGRVLPREGRCAFVRAIWTYGTLQTSITDSSHPCGFEFGVDLDSIATRDALSVTFQLISHPVGNPNAELVVDSHTERVMDSTDGTGTCGNVDTDRLTIFRGTHLVFDGKVVFFCSTQGSNALMAKVTGHLFYDPAMGYSGRLTTYFQPNDSLSVQRQSDVVTATSPVLPVLMYSPIPDNDLVDILSVRIGAVSGSSGLKYQEFGRT